ncbi:hypothetical protein Tco_1221177 [Tanacetum coccineum]
MADDQPMWGNNRAVAPTPEAAIVAVDLGDNFTVKGHHISMIKDRKFNGHSRADPHKHIAEFVEVCGMFRYGNNNADAIKLKFFPSSLAGEAKICNWRNHNENRNSNPGEENPPIPHLPEKKLDESEFEKTLREFVIAQKTANDFVKNQFYNLKTKVEQGQKNHQVAIQDLETKFGRISDHQSSRPPGTLPNNTQTNPKPSTSNEKPYRPPPARNEHVNVVFTRSGKTYNPPANPNTKTAIFLDDSEDEAEEVKKEAEPLPKKPTQTDTPPLKAYKPKIPYPQRLNKEKMEARYAKFLDMIKEVRINVPLVDVLAGMPNYGKFLKDLVSNKSKMEQISAAFLTEECSAILQNKIPPKLGDPRSFLIPCKLS